MPTKHELRAEKTKQAIVKAAADLFSRRSYEDVTMRDIAKRAGCSHTTIYIYFRDKEELLNHLGTDPLSTIKNQFESLIARADLSPEQRLSLLSREFVHFAISNRTLYPVFFTAKASRVDDKEPVLEVQRLRNAVFDLVGAALVATLETDVDEKTLLAGVRSYFFLLHGIVASYAASEESTDALFERLGPTFDLAFESMLVGLRRTMSGASDLKEGGVHLEDRESL